MLNCSSKMVSGKLLRTESGGKKSVAMTVHKMSRRSVTVTPLDEFLGKPPEGFTVEVLATGYRVHSDPERSLVLIDGLISSGRKVFFCNSLGRWGKFKTYTFLPEHFCIKVIFTTGRLNCGTFGSTPPPGAVCWPRGSICWFLLMTKTQKRKPEVE